MIANTSSSTSAKTEVSYASIKEKALHDIACAILEQSVVDWEAIERGNLTSIYLYDNSRIYKHELLEFFGSDWLDTLVTHTVNYTPEQVLKALGLVVKPIE